MNNYLNDVYISFVNENIDKSYTNTIFFLFSPDNKLVREVVNNSPFNINLDEVKIIYDPNEILVTKSNISKLYSSSDVLNYFISEFKKNNISYTLK